MSEKNKNNNLLKNNLISSLKLTLLMTLLAIGISFPVFWFRIDLDVHNEVFLNPNYNLAIGVVGAVFLLSILINIIRLAYKFTNISTNLRSLPKKVTINSNVAKILKFIVLGVVILFPFIVISLVSPEKSLKWINNYGIQILIYIILGWGLNITVRLTGLLDLGYVAFYAIGAYSLALLTTEVGLPLWLCVILAGLIATFWSVIISLTTLKLNGDYLAIATLAFSEIVRIVIINWYDVFKGYSGISGMPSLTFFGLNFNSNTGSFADIFNIQYYPIHKNIFLYYIILVIALAINLIIIKLKKLPIGRAWEAFREDEIACKAIGINTKNIKLSAFMISAAIGGIAGSLFAIKQNFVSPESFVFMESATVLSIVVLGGMGSQLGVVLAAFMMIGGVELLRELQWLQYIFGSDFDPTKYRLLIFGLIMVIMMIIKPKGLISRREPSITK